jgi:hypothetical protein
MHVIVSYISSVLPMLCTRTLFAEMKITAIGRGAARHDKRR